MSASRELIQWNSLRPQLYPWIQEKNPYRILLSEFLLQQTRSDQALGYYERMLNVFPTINRLAEASEDELLRQWQGLGYYSRARNLHKTAKHIVLNFAGQVPKSYEELIKLPGIGPYTAAAISSFAFGERRAVVDGNVYRVLARYHIIDTPINSSPARKQFTTLAMELLDKSNPALFNQAIMNLGAQICLPKKPMCPDCPLVTNCQAYKSGTQHLFPVKVKKKASRARYFHYLDLQYKKQTVIQKRSMKDIWQGLYQFPLLERNSARALSQRQVETFLASHLGIKRLQITRISETNRQILSHQHVYTRFYEILVTEQPFVTNKDYIMINRKNLSTFAFPRSVTLYLHSINELEQK